MPPSPNSWRARLLRWWPTLVVTLIGLAVIWPIPAGQMPLSADHTVHLTRTWMWAQELASGNIRGWSPVWFFGTPVGELYPVLGDAMIIGVRILSFGLLDWPAAYAVGFTLVFLTQGWVLLRAGKALGWGVVPGLVAATLALVDVGSYREGGFIYTVYYGVWPQALATSFTWLGIAELTRLPRAKTPAEIRRTIAWAAAAMGAALLAHPMSMAVFALAGPTVVFVTGLGGSLRKTTARGIVAGGLGVALALWWVVPMLGHRAWMASYGWLWQPLDVLVPRALEGQWAQSMPPLVGHCVTAGIVLVALVGNRAARAFAVVAIGLWFMSARDIPWAFRLDLVSEGFTHLQYQRFLTAAKPGLFLMAGALVGGVAHLAATLWSRGGTRARTLAGACGALVLASVIAIAQQQADEQEKNPVSDIQTVRIPKLAELDPDYVELRAWMAEQWRHREQDYRFVVHDQRNIHWFMDLPVLTDGAPILKLGFTPGDNFVHKPERGPRDLLDRAQVRYEIRRGQRKRRGEVARFGMLAVLERPSWAKTSIAELHGDGQVEVLEADPDEGRVRVKVTGTTAPTRLLLGVAGFPRWSLEGPDGPVDWVEAPATGFGPGATQADRLAGDFRGGKVGGDDGTEPTLIAADVTDGEYELRYHAWRTPDVLAALVSALAAAVFVVLLGWPARAEPLRAAFDRVLVRLATLGHPLVWAAAAIALAGGLFVKVQRGHAAQDDRAVELALAGRASVLQHVRPGFTKADMLIRPALVFPRRHRKPAVAVFESVTPGVSIAGWAALEDDDTKRTKQGTVTLTIEVRPAGGDAWTSLYDARLPHRPGRIDLDLPLDALADQPVDVRISSVAEGKRAPELGVALSLDGGGP